jgi:uroporphyrinogen decarboxylase
MNREMTSMERVLTAISHKEPDRIPLFLLLSMYGAKELGMTVKEYFGKPQNIIEAQVRMTKKYNNDCYYGFSYAAIEFEAWGGEVLFSDDGPPNAGAPIIKKNTNINTLSPPSIKESKGLLRVLNTIEDLKKVAGDTKPIIGVVMSPVSLPVMQMGFDNYLDVMIERPDFFNKLIEINREFCIKWANAQLAAGATAICYFDPISSTSIITKNMYNTRIHEISKSTIEGIKGPTALHLASGNCMPIINELLETGIAMIGVSSKENIGEIKDICRNRQTVLGNLNGIEMCNWSSSDAENAVIDIIKKAGKGGGLIISDNHGEIPLQVKEDTLLTISETVNKWGRYPLTWVGGKDDES